jgi:hypothetical protein
MNPKPILGLPDLETESGSPSSDMGIDFLGLTICQTDEFVQSHFSDGNLNPISNPPPP